MSDAFMRAINAMDEEALQSLYGRWKPLEPAEIAKLLEPTPVRWWIAGGRAARIGAQARHHADTDVAVRMDDLAALREHLSDWDLWEAHNGTLRPLLPSDNLRDEREGLWARRDAQHPWQLDLLLDRSDDQWSYKRDRSIRVPWERALHAVDGVPYLRPELALLHKAHLDRPKDRADLAAARLDPDARAWLASALAQLGYHAWAQAALTPEEQAPGRLTPEGRWPA